MTKQKIPKVRFRGYDGCWEKTHLENLAEVIMGQSPSSENYTDNPNDYILVQGNADIKNNRVVPRVWTTQITKVADINDILLSVRAPVGDVGITDYKVVIGRGVAAIKGNDFLYQLLSKMKNNGFWNRYITGSTFESISSSDIKKAETIVPISNEQSQIGSLFSAVDSLLSSYKDNLENYQSLKKSMLSKMFPKGGQTVPEIRLDGFDGEWEKRKLLEVASYRNGKAHEKDVDENGEFIIVNSKFVSTNGRVKKFSNTQIEPLRKGEIAFVLSDVPNGRALARTFLVDSDCKYSLNQRIAGIAPIGDSDFLHQLINRNKYFLKFDNGVGQTNLSKTEVEEFVSYYPSLPEQQAIGSFFSNLDELISSYQSKIDELETLKKKLLQDMFI